MNRLIARGWVLREPGLQGKYYPATKEHRGMSAKAEILGEVVASRILVNNDFQMQSPFFKRSDQKIENALFEFSNKIGAVITYLLIQSMNPCNGIGEDTKNAIEKDLNIEIWIDDVLTSLRSALLPCIKENLVYFWKVLVKVAGILMVQLMEKKILKHFPDIFLTDLNLN